MTVLDFAWSEASSLPDGVSAVWAYDSVGEVTDLSYTAAGGSSPLAEDSRAYDVFGQARLDAQLTHLTGYAYDGDGRLTQAIDITSSASVTRSYGFDGDSNRASLVTASTPYATGTTTTTTASGSFDDADRDTASGYAYDGLGRTTTLPSGDTSTGTGSVSLGYYANDMVAYQAQTNSSGQAVSQAYTLDPEQDRVSGWTVTTAGTAGATHTNHYADDSDSPAWTDEGNGSWTRDVSDISGALSMVVTGTGGTASSEELQLADIHGDVIATMADTTGAAILDTTSGYDEYGNALPSSATARYGWLGTDQRSTDAIGGLTLMGVRLYNPVTGRFLTADKIPGANAGPYSYVNDPLGATDLTGLGPHVKVHWWGISVWEVFSRSTTEYLYNHSWTIAAVVGAVCAAVAAIDGVAGAGCVIALGIATGMILDKVNQAHNEHRRLKITAKAYYTGWTSIVPSVD